MNKEQLRLTAEEIAEACNHVPTADQWKEKPSHKYWERLRLIDAQIDKVLSELAGTEPVLTDKEIK